MIWRRVGYAVLAGCRVLGCFVLLGMVHPDEFFQSQEVIARHFLPKPSALRRELVVPWEFELPTPNRSIVIPYDSFTMISVLLVLTDCCGYVPFVVFLYCYSALIAGLPYKILELLGIELSGWLLLVTPRLLLCCLSFAFDVILYQIVGKRSSHHKAEVRREKQEKALLLFASSWPTLVFLCRPFSNTLESLALALCFATLFLVNPHRRVLGDVVHVQTFLLGSLLAVGFFTRFTFPVFFFPLGLELVRQQDAQLLQAARKKEGVLALSLVQRFVSTLGVCLQGFVAFLMWAILFVVVDTLYYRPEVLSDESSTSLLKNVASNAVVAPVNNLLYNTQYGNLELHGVHPRVTHLALNVPMLFGPLFFIFLVCCIRFPDRTFFGTACVVFPLACLSLAPHQEPRFLLPAMVPLHIFAVSRDNRSASCFLTEHKLGISLWIVFNFVLTLFFGMLHQGGVVPLLLSLSSIGSASVENSTTAASWLTSFCNFDGADNVTMGMLGSVPLVFAKTYMPPRFLLAGMTAAPAFQVIDLAGKNTVDDDLAELLGADKADRLSEEHRATVFMVLPASVDIRDMVSESSVSIPSMSRLGGCGPHVSTEDFAFDKPFSLELYAVTLASRTWTTLS